MYKDMESKLHVFRNTSSEAFWNNLTSNSSSEVYINQDIKYIHDIIIIVGVIILMIVMGSDISWKQIWNNIRRPVGPVIGIVCQFVIMPLAGFIYSKLFQFESNLAVGLLIISCCPGGALSNIITYNFEGDVPLSVTMTSISTVLALVFMPLNIYIYSRNIQTSKLIIPYINIAISLVMITSPLALGTIMKWKMPKASVYITKWGNFLVLGFICTVTALEFVCFPFKLHLISWKIYMTMTLLPITGFLVGYFISFVSKRSKSTCRAIAIESGFQNIFVAQSVIMLSFDIRKHLTILLMPLYYGIFQCILSFLLCLIYRIIIYSLKKSRYHEAIEEEE